MQSPSDPASSAAPERPSRRAVALDALRGLFLLLMTFGFSVAESIYPAWMYHRQEPPPTHAFVEIAGLTWRDLTYPAFLFTMAAALPITFGLRIARGAGLREIAIAALRRFGLLYVFALIVAHSSGYWMHEYSDVSRGLSLLGFGLLCLIFTRRRADWNARRFAWLQRGGWLATLVFLALSPWLYGATFSFERHDEILAELAFASFAGIWIWYLTRGQLLLRLALLAGVAALSLSAQIEGWMAELWWGSPVPWLFEVSFLKLLVVVIPGTLAGDRLVAWMSAPPEAGAAAWSAWRGGCLAALSFLVGMALVVGMYSRCVLATSLVVLALCGLTLALVRAPGNDAERLTRDLCVWSVLWLVLGLLLEPLEGGIKKVPGTLSYYFTTAGLTLGLLASFVAITELLRGARRVSWLVDVGQNPLVGYVLFTLFLDQVVDLIPWSREILAGTPAQRLVRSALYVFAVAACVRELTRRRVFWRA